MACVILCGGDMIFYSHEASMFVNVQKLIYTVWYIVVLTFPQCMQHCRVMASSPPFPASVLVWQDLCQGMASYPH